ncbi:MAG TPA: FAD:protein FMN transferase [Pyrinomonadaceae bacterium]|nr:FAD:protein FMN transferase [Pyrinomonadaceae bacterium]
MLSRRNFLNGLSRTPAAPLEKYWLHVNRSAMACRFEVTIPPSEQSGVEVARDALDEVDRLEEQLTIFRESSEVTFINREAASAPVRVEPSLFELLLLCQQLYCETDGAFDITSGPLSNCWGFLRKQNRVPTSNQIEESRSYVGSDKLLLDCESHTIRFARPGVGINLGSIGKGYALDRVARTMRGRVRTALLSAGSSSVLAVGSGDTGHNGWSVGVRNPRCLDRRLALLRLRDCAMSTSGSEEQYFVHDGKRYGHIIDPRTGQPAEHVAGVTVIAQSAAVSDALATAFYVGGPALAERYCSRHPDVLAIMLEADAERPVVFGSNRKCEVEIT